MGYRAEVFRVMVSSPSDVDHARRAVIDAIHQWNADNGFARQTLLEPLHWQANAVPEMGASAQDVINGQLLAPADILIAIFGSRLGTPTGNAASGTAEEIQEAEASGKPVHLFFSEEPHPNDLDTSQLDALRVFRAEVQRRALVGTFRDPDELGAKVTRALNQDVGRLSGSSLDGTAGTKTVVSPDSALRVQPGEERLARKTDAGGNIRYDHNHWVTIENLADVDATELTLRPVGGHAFWVNSESPTTIHAGTSRRFPLTFSMGTGSDPQLYVEWTMDGSNFSKTWHVG